MIKKLILLLLISQFCFTSCASTQSSSGILIGDNVRVLPEGVPKKIGVYLFTGDSPINMQSTDQFSAGLLDLGFEVVERQRLALLFDELTLQETGLTEQDTQIALGKQLGLEGIIVGSVTGESSSVWVDSHLNVRLIDIQTGKLIWSATAKDPRMFTISYDVKTSIVHTTRNALKMLKKDLLNIK